MENGRGKESKIGRGARDIERGGERQRLAGVDRFGSGKLGQPGFDPIRDPGEVSGPLRGRELGPRAERGHGRRHGGRDVGFVAVGHQGNDGPGGRVDVVEVAAGSGGDEGAVDVVRDSALGTRHSAGHRHEIRPPSTGRLTPVM